MLVNMKQLLEVAKENKFAVGAFNVADSNFLRVVVEEAEKNNAPAIIAVHPTELDFTKDVFFPICPCKELKIVLFHLSFI